MQNPFAAGRQQTAATPLRLAGLLAVAAAVAAPTAAHAQGTSAVPFMRIAPDARSGGMGEVGGAIADNSTAMYWNPAGLAFQRGTDATITHSPWLPQFGLSDLYYDYLSAKHHIDDLGTFGANITYFNLGQQVITNESGQEQGTFRSWELAAGLGYGAQVTPTLGVGTNLKFILSSLASGVKVGNEQSTGAATAVAIDLATLWRPRDLPLLGDRLSLGLNLANIGPAITYRDKEQADPLPQTLRIGTAVKLVDSEFNRLVLAADFHRLLTNKSGTKEIQRQADDGSTTTETVPSYDPFGKAIFSSFGQAQFLKTFATSVGTEYWYDDLVALRAGVFYEPDNIYLVGGRKFLTFGAGLRYSSFGVDFSYISGLGQGFNPLDNTLRFSLVFNALGAEAAGGSATSGYRDR